MKDNIVIPISMVKLLHQKPMADKPMNCFIELKERELLAHYDFWAEEPIVEDDPSSGWKPVYNYYSITAQKINITGWEISYQEDSRSYLICIFVMGFSKDLRMHFRRKELAEAAIDKLSAWKSV